MSILTKAEIREHECRCREYREKIRQQLQRMGYKQLTLREAERLARRLTRRH